MKISIKRRGMGIFAAVFALVSGAAWALYYPSVTILGGPTPPTNICTGAGFTLPISINTSTTNSLQAIIFVQGVGTVFTGTLNLPTANSSAFALILPGSVYTVPAGTPVTVTAKTFNSTNASGGEAYESVVRFACDTGVVSFLSGAALPVPTMTEWTLALLALLLALAGGTVLYRRRTQV